MYRETNVTAPMRGDSECRSAARSPALAVERFLATPGPVCPARLDSREIIISLPLSLPAGQGLGGEGAGSWHRDIRCGLHPSSAWRDKFPRKRYRFWREDCSP